MWASEEEAEDAIEADPELYKSSWIWRSPESAA
jgi:hypothetical protein